MSRKTTLQTILQRTSLLLVGASSCLMLAHCSPKDASTAASNPTFTTVYANTLQPECASCHVSGGSAWSAGVRLDFSTQALAYSSMINAKVTAIDKSGTCGTVPVVDVNSAATSYLVAEAIASYATPNFKVSGCTPSSYHNAYVNLSATEQTNLLGWINAGALNN